MTSLSDKQEKFCQEYLVDLNATQAAIRAGYSKKTAYSIASENLKKPEIIERLQALRAEVVATTGVTPERVLQEYARLGFFDARRLFRDDGSPKAISELDDDTAAAIVGLDMATTGNSETGVGQVLKYKLADKKGALDSIAKHLGMFIDRSEVTGKDGKDLIPETSDTELARRIAFILTKATT